MVLSSHTGNATSLSLGFLVASQEWFYVSGQMSQYGRRRCLRQDCSDAPAPPVPAQIRPKCLTPPDADGKTCKDVKKCHTMVEGASPGIGSGCKVFLLILLWHFFLPSTKPLHSTQQLRRLQNYPLASVGVGLLFATPVFWQMFENV